MLKGMKVAGGGIVILSMLLVHSPAQATVTWQQLGALPSTPILSIAIDPTSTKTIYVATWGSGAFKSTDGGSSWNSLKHLTSKYVNCLAIDPTKPHTVYAGTSGGVFKSVDAGKSWSAASSGLKYMNLVASLAIDPSNSQTVYAATDFGVNKSTDGGRSWAFTNKGVNNINTQVLAIAPKHDKKHHKEVFVGGDGQVGVYRSTNGGKFWHGVNGGLAESVFSLTIDPNNNATIYAATLGTGTAAGSVYKSTNGGHSWKKILSSGVNNVGFPALAIAPGNSQTIYAGSISSIYPGTGLGVFKSTDGGNSWNKVNSGLTALDVTRLAIDPTTPQTVYAGTRNGGMFKGVSTPDVTTIPSGNNISAASPPETSLTYDRGSTGVSAMSTQTTSKLPSGTFD